MGAGVSSAGGKRGAVGAAPGPCPTQLFVLPDSDPVPNPNLVFPDSDRGPRCNRARINLHPRSADTPRTGVSCGRPRGRGGGEYARHEQLSTGRPIGAKKTGDGSGRPGPWTTVSDPSAALGMTMKRRSK